MAKVKIQGNASGTGTVTLTAPNTNNDRTITLPDGDVTMGVGIVDNANATAITIDSNENVGIGVVPKTWHGGYRGFQVNALSLMAHKTTATVHTMGNAYHNGSVYKYVITDVATQYSMEDGNHVFRTAASGSADATITWTNQLEMKADGRGLSQFTAKAWVNLKGSGVVAIRDSHNVSSFTDHGSGEYTFNFSNNMANTEYTVNVSASYRVGEPAKRPVSSCVDVNNQTTSSVRMWNKEHHTGSFNIYGYDVDRQYVTVFGD